MAIDVYCQVSKMVCLKKFLKLKRLKKDFKYYPQYVIFMKNGKFGIKNSKGEEIVEAEYETFDLCAGYIMGYKNGVWYGIDLTAR